VAHTCINLREHFDGDVVELVLGPPPGNIVSMALVEELAVEIERLHDEPRKLMIISGEGKHFSFGASVEEHRPGVVNDMLPRFHEVVGSLLSCDAPTMAKVTGMCLGGGFELALACDLIACDERAKFGLPEIKLGVFPPAGSVLLPAKIGDAHATEFVLTGETCTADAAEHMGLVNLIARETPLDDAVNEFVERNIVPKSGAALRYATRAARLYTQRRYANSIKDIEQLYLEELMRTADAVEGIDAFLNKRDPKWTNQ